MMNGQVRAYFEHQAQSCGEMGSPFTERLLRVAIKMLNRETQTGRRILDWPSDPRPDALALRLAGGLHALALSGMDRALAAAYPPNAAGDLESAVGAAVSRHDAWLSAWLDNPPQTNETGRSAVLLPGFLAIARETGLPLALAEIGSSAGLGRPALSGNLDAADARRHSGPERRLENRQPRRQRHCAAQP
jgi:hypothetical protein